MPSADRLVAVSSPIATSGRIVGDAAIPDGQVLVAGCTVTASEPPASTTPPAPTTQSGPAAGSMAVVVARLAPSAVTVRTGQGAGSGVVYRPDIVLTNQWRRIRSPTSPSSAPHSSPTPAGVQSSAAGGSPGGDRRSPRYAVHGPGLPEVIRPAPEPT